MLEKMKAQWHPKNPLSPSGFKPKSNKKVWWVCDKGHEWEAIIATRTSGTGCPYCAHKKAPEEASLKTLFPDLSLQWHPELNQPLTPALVTPGSNRKVWWFCDKKHAWKAPIGERCRGRGCPYCSNKKVDQSNSLSNQRPDLASEWHPTLNGDLTPHQVTPGSGKNIWWICKKGHVWQRPPYYRTKHPCPYCVHEKVTSEYNLAFCYPGIAKEFHPDKNGPKKPQEFMPRTSTKLWWLCNKGHEWQAAISSRTAGGTNCPHCFSQTSRMELRIYSELKAIFLNVIHRYKDKDENHEIDIYLPEIKIGIEVDSKRYHDNENKKKINLRKNVFFESNEIIILRARELDQPKLSEHDLSFPFKFTENRQKEVINSLLMKIIDTVKVDSSILAYAKYYLNNNTWLNDLEYKKLIDNGNSPPLNISLAILFPAIAEEWHLALNEPLTPKKVTSRSSQKVFWLCKKKHAWKASISDRTRGKGCPFCKGSKPTDENNLQIKYPHIAKQWHPDKNEDLLPEKILPTSHKKVWWLCENNHEWQSTVANRTAGESNCPDCTKTRVSAIYNLEISNPLISAEWHPTLNESLKPSHVTPGSKKKVYWLCDKAHIYQATINNRTANKSKCPYCTGKKPTMTNNLIVKYPEVAAEWHPSKNIDITPYDILPASNKKIWWLCSRKHEWQATPGNRTNRGSDCPYCARRLKKLILPGFNQGAKTI
jgi:hypothetical protein